MPRQLGRARLVGCGVLKVEVDERVGVVGEARVSEGELRTLDGESGNVYGGRLSGIRERPERELAQWQQRAGPPANAFSLQLRNALHTNDLTKCTRHPAFVRQQAERALWLIAIAAGQFAPSRP